MVEHSGKKGRFLTHKRIMIRREIIKINYFWARKLKKQHIFGAIFEKKINYFLAQNLKMNLFFDPKI